MRRQGQGASAVAPNDAIRMMNEGAVLVDVRSTNQFKDGHIAGARNIPGDQIATEPRPSSGCGKTLVLCCDSGSTPQRPCERWCVPASRRIQPARRPRGLEAGEPAGREGLSVRPGVTVYTGVSAAIAQVRALLSAAGSRTEVNVEDHPGLREELLARADGARCRRFMSASELGGDC